MKVTFPRIVLAEFNTHRMFSRNSASSRAIPFEKMVQMVTENPFIPIAWQTDHKGMQGSKYITDPEAIRLKNLQWIEASKSAIAHAEHLHSEIDQGVHSDEIGDTSVTKQLCNRLLEPFMWHTVIVTATEWENFFKLRCPSYEIKVLTNTLDNSIETWNEYYCSKKDVLNKHSHLTEVYSDLQWLLLNKGQAEIHIQLLAEAMYDALNESTPKELKPGEWHIPFGDNIDAQKFVDLGLAPSDLYQHELEGTDDDVYTTALKLKIAVARCARISYQTYGDNPKIDYEADIKLHDMLASNGHASPFEHVAKAMTEDEYEHYGKDLTGDWANNVPYLKEEGWCRNFKGFIQYRELLENN